jgi:hypothetical protein
MAGRPIRRARIAANNPKNLISQDEYDALAHEYRDSLKGPGAVDAEVRQVIGLIESSHKAAHTAVYGSPAEHKDAAHHIAQLAFFKGRAIGLTSCSRLSSTDVNALRRAVQDSSTEELLNDL